MFNNFMDSSDKKGIYLTRYDLVNNWKSWKKYVRVRRKITYKPTLSYFQKPMKYYLNSLECLNLFNALKYRLQIFILYGYSCNHVWSQSNSLNPSCTRFCTELSMIACWVLFYIQDGWLGEYIGKWMGPIDCN